MFRGLPRPVQHCCGMNFIELQAPGTLSIVVHDISLDVVAYLSQYIYKLCERVDR